LSRSVQIQSILYNLPAASVSRAIDYLASALTFAQNKGVIGKAILTYGDCSPQHVLDDAKLTELRKSYVGNFDVNYTFFDANLGSAGGHNRLLKQASSDLILILNPDVLASPTLFVDLCSALARPDAGFIEGRQLPVEHHKDYDRITGETSWGSTACLLGERSLFEALNGFDSDTFFLYCDDVDLTWRARLLGKKIIFCPEAVVYHDKRLNHSGGWMTSAAERYYSAEAGLMLPYKFSRSDLTENYLRHFSLSLDADFRKAAQTFKTKRLEGKLPAQLVVTHPVASARDKQKCP
jgi:GT2 family glycosyltransferase